MLEINWIFREHIKSNEQDIAELNEKIKVLLESQAECKNQFDSSQAKEKVLEKTFKKDFMEWSPIIQEQAIKLYR